ncbi:hypothetical protein ACFXJ8_16125 [Nonomuraea sp. NPDC059194]|uniref:hypothetical protein n=1 Tax=Nonomuraea sp. NPDC059194 TaxID=3346764 RepID=UPI0036A24740
MKIAYAAMAWSGLYVASKVLYALEGRLGVTGGPHVSPDSYQAYGPGEVSMAQWANAGSGLFIIAVLLLGLLNWSGRWPRRILLTLHWLFTAMAAVGGVGMLATGLFTDRGGALFGGYCAVWAVLLYLSTRELHRRPTRELRMVRG